MSAIPGQPGRIRLIAGQARHLGAWKRSLPRLDDKVLAPASPVGAPTRVELDDKSIPIFDQGSKGTCTSNGGCFQAAWLALKLNLVVTYSRLFLYAMTRTIEGTPLTEDSGCEPRDVFMALAKYGVPEEAVWPYSDNDVAFTRMPPDPVKQQAIKHTALMFYRCLSIESLRQSIIDGFPVGFGVTLYEGFESDAVASSGIAPMPADGEKPIGGHYMVGLGFDDAMKIGSASPGAVKVRNSWSHKWGQGGYVWMPYDYWRTGLASDMWTLRRGKV